MKLYVPNPQLWVDYFDRITKGTSNQRGGGRRPRIIMVKPSRKKGEDRRISIKAVLPTEQTTAQAKSELVREDINPKNVEKVFQNLSERRGESTKKERVQYHLLPPRNLNDRNVKNKKDEFKRERLQLKVVGTYLSSSKETCRYSTRKNSGKDSCQNWNYLICPVSRPA